LHFKYSNLTAFQIKTDWYKMMEFVTNSTTRTLEELAEFYEKWPVDPLVSLIPHAWVSSKRSVAPYVGMVESSNQRLAQMREWWPSVNATVRRKLKISLLTSELMSRLVQKLTHGIP
jgi:hypothetical protein